MALQSYLGNLEMAAWIFSLLTQSLILLLISWALARTAKTLAPPLKSGILLTVIVLLVLLPAGILVLKTSQGSLYQLPISPRGQSVGPGLEVGNLGTESAEKAAIGTSGQNQDASSEKHARVQNRAGLFGLRAINPVLVILNGFGLIWIAGFLILLGRLLYGMAFLSGFRSSLVEIPEEGLTRAFEVVRDSFPTTRIPSIYLSPAIDSPVALGVFRPMIVLPQCLYKNLSPEELTNILMHETAHIRHLDQVSGLLQRLLTSFYWWNPLAYALSASFSVAREDVSDNYAIQKSDAHSYAKCLVALAQKTTLVTRFPAAVGMATPHMTLEDRVKNIVSKERVMDTKLKRPLVVLLAVVGVLLAAFVVRYSWTLAAADDTAKAFVLPPGWAVSGMAVEQNRIYLSEYDAQNFSPDSESYIAVHSLPDFSLLAKIGKKGKGPGEFLMGPGRFSVVNGQIWAEDIRKIMAFSKDGDFRKEMPIPRDIFAALYPIVPLGDKFVSLVADRADITKNIDRMFGRIFDADLRLINEFYGEIPFVTPPPPPPPPPPAGRKAEVEGNTAAVVKVDYQAVPECIDFAVADDKIFVADTRKGFHIAVFDSSGIPLYEINQNYVALPVPPEYSSALKKKLNGEQGWLNKVADIKVRDSFPAFYSFKIADGKIYVSTYAEQDGLHELVVMDLKGNILKRSFSFPLGPSYDPLYDNFFIARDKYAISGDKIYYLAKSTKDGSYEVRSQELK
jgi:beta-lactamase regulating signal transducer with metallopeptidase domain